LHGTEAVDKHLWSNHLLLLRLVELTLPVEELVLHAWLTRKLLHHIGVDEDWSTLHHHRLLSILPWCTERLSCISLAVALSRHHLLHNLASIHDGVHHLRLHSHGHLWLTAVVLARDSLLELFRTVGEGALASVGAGSSTFKELALHGLVVSALLETASILLLSSLEATLVVASTSPSLIEEVWTSSTSATAVHRLTHSATSLRIIVVVASSEATTIATATAIAASVVLISTTGHASVISKATRSASSEVGSRLVATSTTLRVVSISRPWVDGHASHGIRFHMIRNRVAWITDFSVTVSEVTGVTHLAVPVVLEVATTLSLIARVDLRWSLGSLLLIVERHLLLTWLWHLLLLWIHTLNHRLALHLLLHHLGLLLLEWLLLENLLIWR